MSLLQKNLWHQETVYEVTAPAVPFLALVVLAAQFPEVGEEARVHILPLAEPNEAMRAASSWNSHSGHSAATSTETIFSPDCPTTITGPFIARSWTRSSV